MRNTSECKNDNAKEGYCTKFCSKQLKSQQSFRVTKFLTAYSYTSNFSFTSTELYRTVMPILFAIVARQNSVLARYASCVGNFQEVVDQILPKVSSQNAKLTYAHSTFLFHYISEDGITYLCITDDDFERSRAFLYLNEIKRRFQDTYGVSAQTAQPFAMNSDFSRVLANQMKHFSEAKDLDSISRVQGEIDELKNIMVENIENLSERGERLDLLVDKAENLNEGSVTFRTQSRTLARQMYWKNIKMYVIIGIVGIVVLYLIISAFCGGLGWQTCVGKKKY